MSSSSERPSRLRDFMLKPQARCPSYQDNPIDPVYAALIRAASGDARMLLTELRKAIAHRLKEMSAARQPSEPTLKFLAQAACDRFKESLHRTINLQRDREIVLTRLRRHHFSAPMIEAIEHGFSDLVLYQPMARSRRVGRPRDDVLHHASRELHDRCDLDFHEIGRLFVALGLIPDIANPETRARDYYRKP